jgi:hypothetical protein
MSNWIQTAEAALAPKAGAPASGDVIERHFPPIFDAGGARALLAPFLAAFLWAAVVFRESQVHTSLDPLALLFRVLALAMTLRAVRVLIELATRIRVGLATRSYGLVVTPEGLFLRTPRGDTVVPREDIVAVREQGQSASRTGRRWADVYVVTQPDSPRLYLALPPLFGHTPRALAEALMRDLGGKNAPARSAATELEPLASKLWERVASGEHLPGVAAIPHGSAWLKRGPYASMLLGVAVLDGFFRLPKGALQPMNPSPALLLAAALAIVPLAWILITRASLAPRRGLSVVLTPSELLLRTRAGVQRVAWSSVTRSEVLTRSTWSLLQGAHQASSLIITRNDDAAIHFPQAYVGLPVEVVAALCEAYRTDAADVTT